jgi:hypothetical protein
MRVIIALVAAALSFSLNGCARPHQAAYAHPVRSNWHPQSPVRSNWHPQSRPSPQKLTKASLGKPTPPIGKVPKHIKPSMVKLSSPPNKLPEPTTERPVPPLPPKKPEQSSSATPASIPSGEDSGTVEQEREAKFKAAEAKAKREGVEALTSEDIDGLSLEQIKKLRGY